MTELLCIFDRGTFYKIQRDPYEPLIMYNYRVDFIKKQKLNNNILDIIKLSRIRANEYFLHVRYN